MKTILSNFISATAFQPFKQGTWEHLQQSYTEALDALVKSQIGSTYDATKVYILYGCIATGTDPGARTFTSGAVFYNGIVYLVPAASFTSSGSDVAIGTITTSYYADAKADPVLFTDGSSHNVHEIKTMVISAGVSGSGDADFDDWIPNSWKMTSTTSGIALVSGTATFSKAIVRYKVTANQVVVNYAIELNISAYSGGIISFNVPLQIPSVYTPDATVALFDSFNTSGLFLTSSGVTNIGRSVVFSASSDLFIEATNQTVTGVSYFFGQIIYSI